MAKRTILLLFVLQDMMAMQSAGVPATEWASWREQLAARYGSRLVDEGDRRILVVRVPRDEPDPVNDVESAIDFLDPDDVARMTHCILIGQTRIAQVYAGPMQDLMQERVRFDGMEIQALRQRMPEELTFQLYRSENDPQRRWRLAIRIPCASIKELQEDHLTEVADCMGSQLEGPRVDQLAAVYLIATQDHVRMEADHVVQELRRTWKDEDRRRQRIEAQAAAQEAAQRRKEAERRNLMRDLNRRFQEREQARARDEARRAQELEDVARAQAARAAQRGTGRLSVSNDAIAALAAAHAPSRPDRAELDALQPLVSQESEVTTRADPFRGSEPRGAAHEAVAAALHHRTRTVDRLQEKVDGLTNRAQELRPGEPVEKAVARKLSLLGYDVLLDPGVGPDIDMAAERAAPPSRLVVRVLDRLDPGAAGRLVALGKQLDVDQVLCVAEQADEEAKRLLVASKVTWFRPHELGSLRL